MTRFTLYAATALTLALPAAAQERFTCPQKGGSFTFALEARVPNLDQHAGNAAATRRTGSATRSRYARVSTSITGRS